MRNFQASSGMHLWAFALCASLGACATVPKDVARTARADLDCPRVEINKLSDGRYGAYGCGRGAVYAELCEGSACRVGRLRHGHEAAVGAPSPPAHSPAPEAPREIIAAPDPGEREVIAAPAPQPREIIAAPPPGSAYAPADENQTAPADRNQTADQNQTLGSAQVAPAPAPAPVPLSEGDLSAPYETAVPSVPTQQKVTQPPPEPLVEDRPPAPYPQYVWVHGYWWWGPTAWVWVPGYWCPPTPGYAYMPGYWYWSVGYWWYWPGGFGYPGSRVVVYQVAPRPRNVVQVRSFRPRNVVHATPRSVAPSPRAVVSSRPAAPSTRAFTPRQSPILHYPTPRAVSPSTSFRNNAPGSVRSSPSTFASPSRSFAPRVPSTSPGSVGRVVTPRAVTPRSVTPRASSGVRSSVRATPNAGLRPSVQRSSVPRSFHMRPAPARSTPRPSPRR